MSRSHMLPLLLLSACSQGAQLVVDIDSDVALAELSLKVAYGESMVEQHLAQGNPIELPARLLIRVANDAVDVSLIFRARTVAGNSFEATRSVRSVPDEDVSVTLRLTELGVESGEHAVSADMLEPAAVDQAQPLTPSADFGVPSTVITLAGGTLGSVDAVGRAASFNRPSALYRSGGYTYIADSENRKIRRIDLSGSVDTLAVTVGKIASLSGLGGNLVLADRLGNQVQQLNLSNNSLVNLNPGAFGGPQGVVVLNSTTYYVSDTLNHCIKRFTTTTSTPVVVAGVCGTSGYVDGAGSTARFNSPRNVIAVQGNLYVADALNHVIRTIRLSDGEVSTFVGGAVAGEVDGVGAAARFSTPHGLDYDASANIFVSDQTGQTVRRINLQTRTVSTIAGQAGLVGFTDGNRAEARFNSPGGIWADDATHIYVADELNHAIRMIQLQP